MKRLDNKVAIITGGAAGIGKETAKTFLREGAKVLLVDINEKSLKETVEGFNNPNVAYCTADVSKADAVKEYVRIALDKFGKIDVFFNNAGIEGTSRSMADYPDDIFNKVMDVNLKGVWYGCKYVIPKMEQGEVSLSLPRWPVLKVLKVWVPMWPANMALWVSCAPRP